MRVGGAGHVKCGVGGGVPEMHVEVVRKKKVNFFFFLRTKKNPKEKNLTKS